MDKRRGAHGESCFAHYVRRFCKCLPASSYLLPLALHRQDCGRAQRDRFLISPRWQKSIVVALIFQLRSDRSLFRLAPDSRRDARKCKSRELTWRRRSEGLLGGSCFHISAREAKNLSGFFEFFDRRTGTEQVPVAVNVVDPGH